MSITIRVQSDEGTKRILLPPNEPVKTLLEKIRDIFRLKEHQIFHIYMSPGNRNALTSGHIQLPLSDVPIKHGDMLYLYVIKDQSLAEEEGVVSKKNETIIEEEIDKILSKKDGKIYRQRDPQLCHHGPQGKCLNCAPLEPWDSKYQESREPPIKHLSFHCYLRKLTSGVDKGKFVNLEDFSCKIKTDCPGHAPWPEGICTKCQPSAITLARQVYRHVDNIMFEDPAIVERFLKGWRQSGVQRLGFLYGRYEEYDEVPLGIKAVVAAIYEPPQSCSPYSIQLDNDPHSKLVDEMASYLGLKKVGWIFTDLEPESNGKVSYKRNIHTHLLTAEECIMAAEFQMAYPNVCTQSSKGSFGSKFVTVCVSGNENNQVDTTGYQVSNQCVSLVRDDCLVPTLDAHELGYIRESTNEQYVPDVFYKGKDEYGIEVIKLARPLPLEYLIVELTTTTPLRPKATLPGGRGEFPVENRETMGEVQTFEAFVKHLEQQKGSNFLCTVSDFHLLYFLFTTTIFHLQPALPELCKAIREQDRGQLEQWTRGEIWQTVEQLIMASSMPSPLGNQQQQSLFSPPINTIATANTNNNDDSDMIDSNGSGDWSCVYCTLHNESHLTVCNACGLPRN